MTSGYTICAGIWKMIEMVAKDPSDLNLNTLKEMCSSLEMVSGNYFKNAQELLCRSPKKDGKYFYLGNNGYKNFILPIYKLCKAPEYEAIKENIPAILRSLFSYEIWLPDSPRTGQIYIAGKYQVRCDE